MTGFVGSIFTWTHTFSITQRPFCNLKSPAASDWFVAAGSNSIALTDLVLRHDVSKAFEIQPTKLTTDGTTCSQTYVTEVRLIDNRGVNMDVIFDSTTSG
jgi:hypothetical protein